VERIEGERVILRRPDPETGTTWTTAIEDVDTVILAAGARPNQALAEDLEDAGYDVHAVGDCVEPGFAIDAIYQGSEVARRI
jgi:hypothetical protein